MDGKSQSEGIPDIVPTRARRLYHHITAWYTSNGEFTPSIETVIQDYPLSSDVINEGIPAKR